MNETPSCPDNAERWIAIAAVVAASISELFAVLSSCSSIAIAKQMAMAPQKQVVYSNVEIHKRQGQEDAKHVDALVAFLGSL